MITVARTAITARFAATIAWTANSGSRRSATSWAMKPRRSMTTLTTNRHWLSMRGTRPGSTPPGAGLGLRPVARLADGDGLHDGGDPVAQRRDDGSDQAGEHGMQHLNASVRVGTG